MKKFREQMQQQLEFMELTGKLFKSVVPGITVWNKYLSSFKEDPIFRDPDSTTHNCNHCNNFIRRYGNIVAIDENNNIITLFDFIPESEEYISVNSELKLLLRNSEIQDVFFETVEELNSLPYESIKNNQTKYRLGVDMNIKRYTREEAEMYGVVKPNQIVTFEHMSLLLDKSFVKSRVGSIEAIQAEYRDNKNVFKRAMDELSLDTLYLVKDLIKQGSLLDGDTHLSKIEEFIPYLEQYQEIVSEKSEIWCWKTSYNLYLAKFKNTLIGVLCTELSEGLELNKACENWNKRVDPLNYMKATAPITNRQIQEAKVFVDDNGYTASFKRRPATIDDIKASEILHLNANGGNPIKDVHLFDNIKSSKSTKHKRSEFDKVEEVSIAKFMYDILPGCTSVEAYLKNGYENNFLTLTTAENKNSKQIFKWNNNFSWTFNGNLAGKSMIKEAVKTQGGGVDGILRFSIMWSDKNEDNSDLDAHCQEYPGNHIYYNSKYSPSTKGELDIDILRPLDHKASGNKVVENITYPSFPKENTKFEFWVRNYANRGSLGFQAEIEFLGLNFSYRYDKPLRQDQDVKVADVTYKDGEFTIKHHIEPYDGFEVEKEIYGLSTNQFHKVNLVCLSPNHWEDNEVGNKHYFFFLEGAQAKQSLRSFHNENLKSDLVTHRKVMEVLATTTMVESVTNELSGIGFNATVRDELILKLSGTHKRIIKVKF